MSKTRSFNTYVLSILCVLLVLFSFAPARARAQTAPPVPELPGGGATPGAILSSPIFAFLTQGSNWMIGTYTTFDTTSHSFGGGIGAGYKISEFVVPVMRLDYINGGAWLPSGSLQLQVPVKILGKLEVVPFTFSGVATSLNHGNDGDVVGIFGIGASVHLPASDKWYVPYSVLCDYERWTGGGFNNNQIRFGLAWRL